MLIDTAYAQTDGNIKFKPIDFTLTDEGSEFFYYISEVKPDGDDGITYDDSVKEVSVTVADDGHGHMVATPAYDNKGMTFTNSKSGNLVITKEVRGNGGNKEQLFTFTLTLTNGDGSAYTTAIAEPAGAIGWAAQGNGVYTFQLSDSDSITIPVPWGTNYRVAEENLNYRTSVNITSGGQRVTNAASGAAAQAQATYEHGDHEITFTNRLTMVVPTGINMSLVAGIAAIALAGAAGIIFFGKKKAKKSAEE